MKKNTMTTKDIIIHNISRVVLLGLLVATPLVSFGYTQNLSDLVVLSVQYFNQAVYLIIAIAVVVFVWNIYNYFFKADVENKKDAGLYVMYSVIGFFIILSFWGLVNIVGNTFNLNTTVPSLNFFGSSGGSSFSSQQIFQIGGSNSTNNNGGGSNSTNNNGGGSNSSPNFIGPTNETSQYPAPIGPVNENPSSNSALPDQTCTANGNC